MSTQTVIIITGGCLVITGLLVILAGALQEKISDRAARAGCLAVVAIGAGAALVIGGALWGGGAQ